MVQGGMPPLASATLAQYADLPAQQAAGGDIADAPDLAGLYLFGALGSRGLCSAPLAAEAA